MINEWKQFKKDLKYLGVSKENIKMIKGCVRNINHTNLSLLFIWGGTSEGHLYWKIIDFKLHELREVRLRVFRTV